MSGGSYALTGRQFLTIYALLNSPCKRKASQKMLFGKMRNRIERKLRMEEQEGARVFLKLKPTFKPAFERDGTTGQTRPAIGQDGQPAKFWEYSEDLLKKPVGEFAFDAVERGAILELLVELIEDDKSFGDQAALCLRVAGWLGMPEEIETRVLATHPLDAYSGKISAPEKDDDSESILED